ncbi:MAG: T9SS type A sorting domain-containing protein [Candidatus Zixiibacteriota bacterium]|nr:MAG: T9SS type A sorting domain-containing protein [candidate division Zixibacteria bacterium]
MKKLIIITVLFLSAAVVVAQDPGMPDTVIVDSVYADLGQSYVDVDIYAVTDDSVMFYTMPITWSSGSEGIVPSEILYYYPLTYWYNSYSIMVDEHYIGMVGWGDGLFFLNTYGIRLRCWQIRFTIDSLAPPQIVAIDTTYDPINGSLLFGLIGGVESFTPQFVPGAIFYGNPADITEDMTLPSRITLLRNYPNPFNTSTTIEFTLAEPTEIELSIYNVLGQKIAILCDKRKPAGKHAITWDAGVAPSGLYFARLGSGGDSRAIKMLLLK